MKEIRHGRCYVAAAMHTPGPPVQHVPDLPQALRSVPLRTIAPTSALVLVFFSAWLAADRRLPELAISLLLTAVAVAATVLAQRRRLDIAGVLAALANAGGCLLAAWVLQHSALAWTFLVLISNFFIVRYEVAAPVNLALVVGLLLQPGLLLAPIQPQALAVIVLTFGFGHRFSRRLQGDRSRLEQLASLDALTGVPNRRALERTLSQQIIGQRESRFRHALVVLDIDHFKDVNDRHGHAAGDAALSDLAAILRFELRDRDQVFRFGGEEFVILAETGTCEALERFTERIRKAVYEALRGPGGRITISLGGAMYAGEQRWQDWFARADAALYEAKRKGRNSAVIAG
ncbi:GGDEF domain-containing protein [Stenotrophomonas sp. ATCM1_4]|uniref:GGDEF domain-containing protein n=1 Tax=Stenotrophomonas sp. ATCM1_4 TaxID=2259330 RepID=UPI001FB72F4C|nr:GGDEF domain-containing protein [Stenotrophomonas sp. ATCM1_4]